MLQISYLDFDLVVERSADGYRAEVRESPGGTASSTFHQPFSDLELENFRLRVGQTRKGLRRLESPESEAIKAFGGKLFTTVFGPETLACLRRGVQETQRLGVGLRLRLNLSAAPELADLPWEYLYSPEQNQFLALSRWTPPVRFLSLPYSVPPQAVKPPLRVLVMISSPSDYPPLDVQREWDKLSDSLADLQERGLVALERLDEASLTALHLRLQRNVYHIFHFIGHGGFDQQAQDGVLVLEDAQQRGLPVSGQRLGTLLHDCRPLRLALLNACEGGRPSRTDPFAGTAQSLLQQGVPAVIAMQFEISDEAAITFAQGFYGALADSYPVDAALTQARRAIFAQGNDLEWGTPVLYMASNDGHLFDVVTETDQAPAANAPEQAPSAAAAAALDEQRRALTDLYTRALSHFYLEQWDEAVPLLQQIVQQQPDYEDAADKLAVALHQHRLIQHYSAGLREAEAGNWRQAIEQFEALEALEPGYRDVVGRLEQARHHQALADYYDEARRLFRARQWQAVVNVFERIRALDSSCPDPDGLLLGAERELQAAEWERRLTELYVQGIRQMNAADWAAAEQTFENIQGLKLGYRETDALLARVRQELARAAAPADPPGAVGPGTALLPLYERPTAPGQVVPSEPPPSGGGQAVVIPAPPPARRARSWVRLALFFLVGSIMLFVGCVALLLVVATNADTSPPSVAPTPTVNPIWTPARPNQGVAPTPWSNPLKR